MPRSPASVRSVYVLLTDACSNRSGATLCGGAKNCGVACLGSVVTIGEVIAVIAHLLFWEVYRKKYRCDAERPALNIIPILGAEPSASRQLLQGSASVMERSVP